MEEKTLAKVKKANLFPASPAVPEKQTTHCPYKSGFNVVEIAKHEVKLISQWVMYHSNFLYCFEFIICMTLDLCKKQKCLQIIFKK